MPTVTHSEALMLPLGTPVGGLAPIGIRWGATISRRRDGTRYFKPRAGCPTGEFCPCRVLIGGVSHDVVPDPPPDGERAPG